MKYLFLPLLILLASCSQYQRVLKSDDFQLKLQYADKYFEQEQYTRALPLYDELARMTRGTEQAERILFRYAQTLYEVRSVQSAAYNFKLLADMYPRGNYAEEALYMHAYSLYRISPPAELEQTNTLRAIDAFQTFVNRFPTSEKVPEANRVIDLLRHRLEVKDIDNARLYYRIMDYRAAIWSLQSVINKYPATDQREELELLLLDSHYQLARKSVEARKPERFQETIDNYRQFNRRYPNSQFSSRAQSIYQSSLSELERLK